MHLATPVGGASVWLRRQTSERDFETSERDFVRRPRGMEPLWPHARHLPKQQPLELVTRPARRPGWAQGLCPRALLPHHPWPPLPPHQGHHRDALPATIQPPSTQTSESKVWRLQTAQNKTGRGFAACIHVFPLAKTTFPSSHIWCWKCMIPSTMPREARKLLGASLFRSAQQDSRARSI